MPPPDPARFPLIAGLGLNTADRLLLEYWLSGPPEVRFHDGDVQPGLLQRGHHAFLAASEAVVQDLMQLYRPLLLIARPPGGDPQYFERLFGLGVAAVWTPPPPGDTVYFPAVNAAATPERRPTAFLIEDDPVFRSVFRQMLYFAGYDVRADQQSLEYFVESSATASGDAKNGTTADDMPALILANLDTDRLDIPEFFYRLQRGLSRSPTRKPRILLMKDFDRPGLDVRTIAAALRPHARRIFHPREAVLVLIEALFLCGPPEASAATDDPAKGFKSAATLFSRPFRPLDELLHGPNVYLREEAPPAPGDTDRAYRRGLPFFWLYDLLRAGAGRGAVLAERDGPGAH